MAKAEAERLAEEQRLEAERLAKAEAARIEAELVAKEAEAERLAEEQRWETERVWRKRKRRGSKQSWWQSRSRSDAAGDYRAETP